MRIKLCMFFVILTSQWSNTDPLGPDQNCKKNYGIGKKINSNKFVENGKNHR